MSKKRSYVLKGAFAQAGIYCFSDKAGAIVSNVDVPYTRVPDFLKQRFGDKFKVVSKKRVMCHDGELCIIEFEVVKG